LNVLGAQRATPQALLEVRREMAELVLEGSASQQRVEPLGQARRLVKRGLCHLRYPASFPLWFHADFDLPILEPVGHMPLHRTIVEFDDLNVDIELDALSTWAIQMLMKPETGSHIDRVSFHQVRRLHIGTPQVVVPGVGNEAEQFLGWRRDVS